MNREDDKKRELKSKRHILNETEEAAIDEIIESSFDESGTIGKTSSEEI